MKTRFIMKPCYCDRLVKAIDNYIQKADNDLSDLLGKEGYAKPKKTLQYAKGIEDDVADILTEETDYFVREAKASDNLDDLQKRSVALAERRQQLRLLDDKLASDVRGDPESVKKIVYGAELDDEGVSVVDTGEVFQGVLAETASHRYREGSGSG